VSASVSPGRRVAARALLAVEDGAHVEDRLAIEAPARPADRALSWHLALGVLRRQGSLDAALAAGLGRSVETMEPPVRIALRIGAFELAFSRVPPHAAVHEAVELVRSLGAGRASGLVNAGLRRFDPARLPADPLVDLPPWLANRWSDFRPWVARCAEPAPLCGVWARGPTAGLDVAPVTAAGEPVEGAFRLRAFDGAVDQLPGFAEGDWWVMDPAAVRVAQLTLAAAQAVGGPCPRVLDACAAPGGKSFYLASRGARVLATDADPARLDRLRAGARRLRLGLDALPWDWSTENPDWDSAFDAVLVDAPCTGLGTIRRHPEIRWRRLPSDPAAMGIRQRALLHAASSAVAPGGVLVYAVCSLEPEEGIAVASALPGWSIVSTFATRPPAGDEDGHQAFVLRRLDDAAPPPA